MIAPYCAYATAEALSLSGIVAILFCGIVMAHYTKPNLSTESQRNTETTFKVLATLAETFVFLYIGVATFLESQAWSTIPFAVVALLACVAGRALNVFPVTGKINALRNPRRKIPKNHVTMLFVSGLRGAIAFALASSAIRDLGESSGRAIRTATLMIVLFTVITVGGACHALVDGLDLRAAQPVDGGERRRGIVGATRVRPRRRRRRGARRGAVQERTLRRRRRTR